MCLVTVSYGKSLVAAVGEPHNGHLDILRELAVGATGNERHRFGKSAGRVSGMAGRPRLPMVVRIRRGGP